MCSGYSCHATPRLKQNKTGDDPGLYDLEQEKLHGYGCRIRTPATRDPARLHWRWEEQDDSWYRIAILDEMNLARVLGLVGPTDLAGQMQEVNHDFPGGVTARSGIEVYTEAASGFIRQINGYA